MSHRPLMSSGVAVALAALAVTSVTGQSTSPHQATAVTRGLRVVSLGVLVVGSARCS